MNKIAKAALFVQLITTIVVIILAIFSVKIHVVFSIITILCIATIIISSFSAIKKNKTNIGKFDGKIVALMIILIVFMVGLFIVPRLL